MNKQPAVSVIVPVYKAESYLHRCVDSLLAQTFPYFEILLIDDGSPDRSGEICDAYAKKDNRVRVFHKENGGVSSARQCGIDNARGEYTIHADPDDWVEPDMLEALYKKAKEEDADMVICDYYEECAGKQKYVRQRPSALDHETVLRELFQQLHGSCWNKVVRRACYKEYAVSYPKGLNLCEDLAVMVQLFRNDLKIGYLPMAYYHYDIVVNEGSMTKMDFESMHPQRELLLCYLDKYLDKPAWRPLYDLMFMRVAIEIFGSGIYSAKQYQEKYLTHRRLLFRMAPWRWKVFLYLAAIGFFEPMRKLYDALQAVKMLVKDY